jgi:hypothetical protein
MQLRGARPGSGATAQITRPATAAIPTASQNHAQGNPELLAAAGVVAAAGPGVEPPPPAAPCAVVDVAAGVVAAVVGAAVVGGAVVGAAVVGAAVVGWAVVGCPVAPVRVAVTLAATLLTADLTLLPVAPHAASSTTVKTIRPTRPAYFLSIRGNPFRAPGDFLPLEGCAELARPQATPGG